MHLAFLNPQGNFDPEDSYWTENPDFGGQLVYVKQVATATAQLGHRIDILTRRIIDPLWPEFGAEENRYDDTPNVRILRLRAGPDHFLRKELLWPHIIRDWIPNILAFYEAEGHLPAAFTGHYADGGLTAALIEDKAHVPFTLTGHSLAAQKMDQLGITRDNLAELDDQYRFTTRLIAERLSINHAAVIIASTEQERFEQYGHPAYRGAVDVYDDRRFAIIPPGVDFQIFGYDVVHPDELNAQAHVRAMLARDLDADRQALPAIIASSRLDPKKNQVGLVRAYGQTPELQAQANLVLLTGALNDPLRDGAEASSVEREVLTRIREMVDRHRLWGKISTFALRGQSALAAAYRFLARRGSVFALTALYEPFGLAPLEAAAAGLPVVVTENGGPSESLREGTMEYGVLVDPLDPEDIARGLLRLLNNPDVWATFAERGRRRVQERYTWEQTAQGYVSLIEQIVDHPEARRPERRLPIHPYFRDARPEHRITLDELWALYAG